jgi:hypothetical protein
MLEESEYSDYVSSISTAEPSVLLSGERHLFVQSNAHVLRHPFQISTGEILLSTTTR